MKEKNPIDELFKQGLEKKEIKPSDAVWSKIEETLEPEENKRGGFYFMRAAVVTLLVGLSSWIFFQNGGDNFGDTQTGFENPTEYADPTQGVDKKEPGSKNNTTNTAVKKKDEPKAQSKEKSGSKDKKETKPIKRSKVTPMMKGSGPSGTQYVNADLPIKHKELPIVDETSLVGNEPLIEAENLEVKKSVKSKKFKIRYTVPVTEKAYYADKGQEVEKEKENKPKFKARVFAYASTQFDNLMKGEPLELPKTDTKGNPQLEISIGKIFSDN